MENLQSGIIAGVTSGTVISLILGVLLHRAKTTIEKEVEGQFNKAFEVFKSAREWKEKALANLIGPVVMHLERTSRVADRYSRQTFKEKGKSYSDAMLMRESNDAVRSILLANGHLVPENLRVPAHKLVAHYDLWINRFDTKFEKEKPTADSVFDVGFAEEPFPKDAVKAFQDSYEGLRGELYDIKPA